LANLIFAAVRPGPSPQGPRAFSAEAGERIPGRRVQMQAVRRDGKEITVELSITRCVAANVICSTASCGI